MSALTIRYALSEAVDALQDYANEGGIGFEALEAADAADEFFRSAWIELSEERVEPRGGEQGE